MYRYTVPAVPGRDQVWSLASEEICGSHRSPTRVGHVTVPPLVLTGGGPPMALQSPVALATLALPLALPLQLPLQLPLALALACAMSANGPGPLDPASRRRDGVLLNSATGSGTGGTALRRRVRKVASVCQWSHWPGCSHLQSSADATGTG